MFRLTMFCEDKNLASVMHSVTGKVIDLDVVPVANGVSVNGKVKARTNGHDKVALFKQWAKDHSLKLVTPVQIKEFAVSIGYSPGSYSAVMTDLKKGKALKKAGGKGNKVNYSVLA